MAWRRRVPYARLLLLLVFAAWSIGAIYFSNLPGHALRTVAAAAFGLGLLAIFSLASTLRRALFVCCVACCFVLAWWLTISPSHQRDWPRQLAELPYAEIEGDRVAIYRVRNFDYRSADDFTVRYDDRTYDLNQLATVDFIKAQWGDRSDVAHTFLSFGFRNGEYLAVSIEPRVERGEPKGFFRGFFKQYELIYVVGDERDLIRVRTNLRREAVYLYPTTSSPEQVRELFLDILATLNSIAAEPRFYNVITQNCTTRLDAHVAKVRPRSQSFWSSLFAGNSDKMAYDSGWIDTQLPFAETKAFHYVNQYVGDDSDLADYSRRIRPHLRNR